MYNNPVYYILTLVSSQSIFIFAQWNQKPREEMSILLVAVILLISLWLLLQLQGRRSWPPGPGRIPLLGSLPFITLKNGILDWVLDRDVTRHKISTVNIFGARIILINDYDLAKVGCYQSTG